MSFNAFTAASLALSASVISLVAPAARADVYDSFGIYGNCDSGSLSLQGPDGSFTAGGRDCRDARKWASKEASRNRRHETQSQLIGLGGNLVTELILNSQQQKQQPAAPAGPSEAELALMQQQQEIELLKLQLQLQAQQPRPLYGDFNRDNIAPTESWRNERLVLGVDFNRTPFCGCTLQVQGDRLAVLKEHVIINSDTYEMAKAVRVDFPYHEILACPNPTGRPLETSSICWE